MALRNKHSRLWLIPVFMVLLLWGCGEDIGLVNGDPHTDLVVDGMSSASIEFDTSVEEDGSMEFEFSNNALNLTFHNFPRLGDADLPNGGLGIRVNQIQIEITDASGVPWPSPVYNKGSFLVYPNAPFSITIDPLLLMELRNEIVERYLWGADICNTLYDEDARLQLSAYNLTLTIHATELRPDGETGESYTKRVAGSAFLTHTGDYVYPITTVPDFCPIVVP